VLGGILVDPEDRGEFSGFDVQVQCWEESWWIQKIEASFQALMNGGVQREVIKEYGEN
jgi:hypothetical protein